MSSTDMSKMKHECCIDIKLVSGKNVFQTTEGKLSSYVVFKVGAFQAQSKSADNSTLHPEWNQTMKLAFIRDSPNIDLLVQLLRYDESQSVHHPEETAVRVIRHLEQRLVAGYETTYTNYKLSNNTILTFTLFSKDIGFSRESIGIEGVTENASREEISARPMSDNRTNRRSAIFSLFSKKKKSQPPPPELTTPKEVSASEPEKSPSISLADRITKGLKSSLRFLGLDDMSAAQLVNFGTGDEKEDMFLNDCWKSYRIRYEELKIKGITSHNRQIFSGTWKGKPIVFKPYTGVRLKQKKDVEKHKSFSRQFRGFVKISQYRNIIRFYGIVVKSRRIGLVMEYCKFGDLKSFLKTNPHYNLRDRYRLLFDIICGMRYIHSKNMVHRNLCPENVMVDENGIAKITNFEKARIKDSGGAQQTAKVGKERYMAHECYEGRYSEKSDVYSFGIITLEVLSGNFELKWSNAGKAVLELKQCGILTEWLFRMINTCLRDNPSQRPTFFDLQKIFLIHLPNIRIPDQPLDLFVMELGEYLDFMSKNPNGDVFDAAVDFTLNPSDCTIKNLKEMIKRNMLGNYGAKKIDKIWWKKKDGTSNDSSKKDDGEQHFFRDFVEISNNEDVFLLDSDSMLVISWVSDRSKGGKVREEINRRAKNEEKKINEEEVEGESDDDDDNDEGGVTAAISGGGGDNDDNEDNDDDGKPMVIMKKEEIMSGHKSSSSGDNMENKNINNNNNNKKKKLGVRTIYIKLPSDKDEDAEDVLLTSSRLKDVIKLIYKHFPKRISYHKVGGKLKKKRIRQLVCTRMKRKIFDDSHVMLLKNFDMLNVYFEGGGDGGIEEESTSTSGDLLPSVIDENEGASVLLKDLKSLANENRSMLRKLVDNEEQSKVITQQKELIEQQKEMINVLMKDKNELASKVEKLKKEIEELKKK